MKLLIYTTRVFPVLLSTKGATTFNSWAYQTFSTLLLSPLSPRNLVFTFKEVCLASNKHCVPEITRATLVTGSKTYLVSNKRAHFRRGGRKELLGSFRFKATHLYHRVHCSGTHLHPCPDVSCTSQSNAWGRRGDSQKCYLVPATSQPTWYKKPTMTTARRESESELLLPIWTLDDIAGADFCRQQGGCGIAKYKGREHTSSFSREAVGQRFPRGDTHKLQNTGPTGCSSPTCRPPARGILMLKGWSGSELVFLQISQGDQCTFSNKPDHR